MQYDPENKRLETDAGELIKQISCPLSKKWKQLMPMTEKWDEPLRLEKSSAPQSEDDLRYFLKAQSGDMEGVEDDPGWQDWKKRQRGTPKDYLKKYCGSCQKCVLNANRFSENQIRALVQVNPNICLHISSGHPELTIKQNDSKQDDWACGYEGLTQNGLPIIQTARSLAAIEDGVIRGYRPLFVQADYASKVGRKFWVSLPPKSGELIYGSDFRGMVMPPNLEDKKDWPSIYVKYDSDRNSSPLAAYMIPEDLNPGDRVFVADIIEEIVFQTWNQGDSWRQKRGEAVWTGEVLEIERRDSIMMVG